MAVVNTSVADFIKTTEHLLTTIVVNAADLAHLEPTREKLGTALDGVKVAIVRQTTTRAQAQQASRDLDAALIEVRDLSTRLRNGIRAQYGVKAEKLTEFGLQPRRPPFTRVSKKKAPETAPPSTAPADSSPGSTPDKQSAK